MQQPLNLLSQLAPDFYAVWEALQARHDATERGNDGERERERGNDGERERERGNDGERERERGNDGEGARLKQVDVNHILEGSVHPWKRDRSSLKVLGFWETREDGHQPGYVVVAMPLGIDHTLVEAG
jgi:hypothetical protein